MTISTRQNGSVTIIDCHGRFGDSDIEVFELGDAVKSAVSAGKDNILLNLTGVSYINSHMEGVIADGLKLTAQTGGAFKLLNPQERVKARLFRSGIDHQVVAIFDNEPEALRSFIPVVHNPAKGQQVLPLEFNY